MIVDPFPDYVLPTLIHVRTQELSDTRAPFVRETILGLQPFFHNVVLATGFECELPNSIDTEQVDGRRMRRPGWGQAMAEIIRAKYQNVIAVMGHFGNGMRIAHPLASALGVPVLGIFGGSDVNVEVISARYRSDYLKLFRDPDSYFIAVANYLAEKLVKEGAPKERTFPWRRGTNLDSFHPPIWNECTAGTGSVRISMAGRFIDVKGHSYAVKAFSKVVKEFPNIELHLIGEGPLEGEIKSLVHSLDISDKVKFTGHLPHQEIPSRLNSVQIGLMASVLCKEGKTEGIPNWLVENHAMAIPVVATTNGGIPEVVLQNKTGYLVPERDIDAMAEAIKKLVSDKLLRKRMGEAARQHVEENFDRKIQARILASKVGQMRNRMTLRLSREHRQGQFENEILNVIEMVGEKIYSEKDKHRKSQVSFSVSLLWKLRRLLKKVGDHIKNTEIVKNSPISDFLAPLIKNIESTIKNCFQSVPSSLRSRARIQTISIPEVPIVITHGVEVRQYMHIAQCGLCPHHPVTETWPVKACPMDLECLKALEAEFADRPLSVPQLTFEDSHSNVDLTIGDSDVNGAGDLNYEDSSFKLVNFAGDLQRVDDIPHLFRELRRIIQSDGYLILEIWPLLQGAAGGMLFGRLHTPFAHRLFSQKVIEQYLGSDGSQPREYCIPELLRWIDEAGFNVHQMWIPSSEENPCSLEIQARFGACLMELGRPASELSYACVVGLKPCIESTIG
jgi:colanic acid/amylovoran biosynthesis glycosyltransferase